MRDNLIIKLEGMPLGKPVKITDAEFQRLRGELLKIGCGMEDDRDWNLLAIIPPRGKSSLELPGAITQTLNAIRHRRPKQRHERREF